MTFEEAKDQIAREAGYESFALMYSLSEDSPVNQSLNEAVQLYATEAIKADREQISEPTKEEIEEEAYLCMNANAEYSAGLTWIEAIEWYKKRTERK